MLAIVLLSLIAARIAAAPANTIDNEVCEDVIETRQACSLTKSTPKTYWYEDINHNGISPFITDGDSWPVFRNIKEFGAKGDGLTDDSKAIQDAINAGNSFAGRSTNSLGTTGQPAVVYFPPGTYLIKNTLQLYVYTVVMGSPVNMPIIKASSTFSGDTMIRAKDPSQISVENFHIGIKNVVIDSQSVARDKSITLLDWSISQATQLTNVVFNMPYDATGHTGLVTPENGSPLMINDCSFVGGAVGMSLNTQQYHMKGLKFSRCTTGIRITGGFDYVVQGCTFEFNNIGVDTSSTNIGFLALIDSSANHVDTLVNSAGSTTGADSLVLENIQVQDTQSTVSAGGNSVLVGGVPGNQAWIWGKVYLSDNAGPQQQMGTSYGTVRPSVLVDGATGSFKTAKPPTYQEYAVDQVLNVKDVKGYPVAGDGVTDDTANLQYIVTTYADCKVLFFPHGTYLVTDTLFFPPGSRVYGETWSAISARGEAFTDSAKPRPMVRVGEPGDIGVAQFSDMVFTVAEVLPGCTLLEVNMAGTEAGDVGFWNTHVRVGGAMGSKVATDCAGAAPADCKAAFLMVHLTASSSAYIDNMWAWTADHLVDGTWLLGLGIEHNTLYQANYNEAQNVFTGFQQSESPYWQGPGDDNPSYAPDPWGGSDSSGLASDPDFSWCAPDDGRCRMALYQRISGSKNLSLFGSGFWTFFNKGVLCEGNCQGSAVQIEDTEGLYYFGLSTRFVDNLVVDAGSVVATSQENVGGWGAARGP
ncbi:glycoside hydrolase family 55 protein [Coniochaeta sp. 2T2.1]|nr:glycoside hydrolase family 55 protein [Coniochaeta sp. 2T2.1]